MRGYRLVSGATGDIPGSPEQRPVDLLGSAESCNGKGFEWRGHAAGQMGDRWVPGWV